MTSMLWVFGDSFSDDYRVDPGTCWPAVWGKSRNRPTRNMSRSGTSNITIFKTFLNNLADINKGDQVLICWSAPQRYATLNDGKWHITEFMLQDAQSYDELIWYSEKFYNRHNYELLCLSHIAATRAICDKHGLDLVMFSGHVDKSASIINRFPVRDSDFRRSDYEELLFPFVESFPRGTYCLLHEWLLLQFSELEDHEFHHARFLAQQNDDYDVWSHVLYDYLTGLGKNIFLDRWHLNSAGHQKFADHIAPLLDKLFIDQKGNL